MKHVYYNCIRRGDYCTTVGDIETHVNAQIENGTSIRQIMTNMRLVNPDTALSSQDIRNHRFGMRTRFWMGVQCHHIRHDLPYRCTVFNLSIDMCLDVALLLSCGNLHAGLHLSRLF